MARSETSSRTRMAGYGVILGPIMIAISALYALAAPGTGSYVALAVVGGAGLVIFLTALAVLRGR